MSFSERLKECRKENKLSQTDLGKRVGLHYTQIGRYERGESIPSLEALKKLSNVLGVSGDFLMEGTVETAAKAHIHDRELLDQFKQIEELESEDKHVIKVFLDAFLTKKKIQQLAL